MSGNFKEIYDRSIKNPEKFWQDASEDIFWFKKPTIVLKCNHVECGNAQEASESCS